MTSPANPERRVRLRFGKHGHADSPAEDRLYDDGASIDADVFAVARSEFRGA